MKSGSPSRTTAAHKTQTKIQAWSSLLFHCCHSSFNPSEAPPWDSRPVSGAGVVHYQLLHRPRSVPTRFSAPPHSSQGHMMRFQISLSLWIVTSCLCIYNILEVAKTEVSNPKRYSLSKLRFCHPL